MAILAIQDGIEEGIEIKKIAKRLGWTKQKAFGSFLFLCHYVLIHEEEFFDGLTIKRWLKFKDVSDASTYLDTLQKNGFIQGFSDGFTINPTVAKWVGRKRLL